MKDNNATAKYMHGYLSFIIIYVPGDALAVFRITVPKLGINQSEAMSTALISCDTKSLT